MYNLQHNGRKEDKHFFPLNNEIQIHRNLAEGIHRHGPSHLVIPKGKSECSIYSDVLT